MDNLQMLLCDDGMGTPPCLSAVKCLHISNEEEYAEQEFVDHNLLVSVLQAVAGKPVGKFCALQAALPGDEQSREGAGGVSTSNEVLHTPGSRGWWKRVHPTHWLY